MKQLATILMAWMFAASAWAQNEEPAVIFDGPPVEPTIIPAPQAVAPADEPEVDLEPAAAAQATPPVEEPAPVADAPPPAPPVAPAARALAPAPTPRRSPVPAPAAPTAQAEAAEEPAVRFEEPGVPAAAPRTAKPGDLRDDAGTTIIGERESPIGLYITPWRDAYSEQGIDRPARLLQVDMSPVDRDVFRRQIEYYRALEDERDRKLAGRPAPAAP